MPEESFHHALTIGWIVLSVVVFLALFLITAPYGRHSRGGWGPSLPSRTGWLLMETPAALAMPFFWLVGEHKAGLMLAFLLLWETHYTYRAFVYPFRLKDPDKQMPVLVVALGAFFNLVNGYINGRWLFTFSGGYPADWLFDPRFLLGVLLFFVGLGINRQSDRILLSLRRPGEAGYRIPRGGLFRWVSSPNYLGEIIEWSGWALATWSLAGVSFALWTAANLIPRAISHHRWYRAHFLDYPEERRAIFPWLW